MKAGWSKKAFGDCIEKVSYTPKIQRKDFLADGKYPIISQEEEFINGYWDDETALLKVTTPIVLFGDRRSPRKLGHLKVESEVIERVTEDSKWLESDTPKSRSSAS